MSNTEHTPRKKKAKILIPALALLLVMGAVSAFLIRRKSATSKQPPAELTSVVHLEVCNMIAGNFKAKLSGVGNHCMLSVPTIITGGDYHMHSLADGGTVEVALEFEGSLLWITLELHS